MKTIALLAQKGGTGKTTLALALAVAAEQDGGQAVIVDLDPQASACRWADRRQAATPVVVDAQPARLPQALARARDQGVDFALIDTPARSEQAAFAAARVADLVLIPCRPQIYDLETVPASQEVLALAGNPPTLVVVNAVPPRGGGRLNQALTALRRRGLHVAAAALTQRAAFGDSAVFGLAPQEYEPAGKAAAECREVYKQIRRLLAESPRREGHEQKAGFVELAG